VTSVDISSPPVESRHSDLQSEALLAELSTRFINVPPGDLDREIEDALRRLCAWHGLDLAALWQASSDAPPNNVLTHIYRSQGGPPVPDRMDAIEHFPWTQDEVLARRTVVLSRLDDAPAEAARDLATLRHFGGRRPGLRGTELRAYPGGEGLVGRPRGAAAARGAGVRQRTRPASP
jgi:hypothetical protein